MHFKNILFSTLAVAYILSQVSLLAYAQPSWDDTLDFTEIERRLKHEKVIKRSSIRSFLTKKGKTAAGTHPVDIVELESGLLGVFKREKACYGEVAAYKAARALGIRLVPPTVLRTIDGIRGSLQFYVDSSIDLLKGSKALDKISRKDESNMNLFYFVMGQWDDHNGNQIVAHSKKGYQLALIDNGGILRRQFAFYGKATFLQKGRDKKSYKGAIGDINAFPHDQAERVSLFDKAGVRKLKEYLPDSYIAKLKAQHMRNVSYVLWNSKVYVKRHKHNAVKTYYASMIKALEQLDRPTMEKIWEDYLPIDSDRCNELIDLTLSRKDQVLAAAKKSRNIIKD